MSVPTSDAYTPEQIAGYKKDNESRVRQAALDGNAVVDGMPLKVTLELTADCDLFCRMCEFPAPREKGRRKGYDLDMRDEVFEMLAPQVFPHAQIVNLTVVGEPLMVPYLDRVIEVAEGWQTKIEYITNGQNLDAEMIEKVGPTAACVIASFDGGTRDTFNRIRIGGDFNVITRNILLFDRWRKARPEGEFVPRLHMNVTIMRENVQELPTVIRVAKLLGVDQLNGAWMIAFNEKIAKSSCFNHKALSNACVRRAHEVAKEVGLDVTLPAEIPGPTEAEIAAVVIEEPDLPDGPLPHLNEALAGGPVPDLEVEAASPDEAFHDIGANIPELGDEGGLFVPLGEVGGVSQSSPDSPPDAPQAKSERDYGSPLQQGNDERRLQAQVAANPSVGVPAEPPKAEDSKYTCKFLWNELFISLNGDVAPCCIQGRPVVGNVHKQDLASIWNGPAMKQMRQRLMDGDPIPCCKDCNYNTMLGQGEYREDTYFIDLKREV